ncbi:hypothetical protein N7513_002356 [Penicillium frequentans]|nr:hypothetical protein N7513_002356 [Penicillium glabrum]
MHASLSRCLAICMAFVVFVCAAALPSKGEFLLIKKDNNTTDALKLSSLEGLISGLKTKTAQTADALKLMNANASNVDQQADEALMSLYQFIQTAENTVANNTISSISRRSAMDIVPDIVAICKDIYSIVDTSIDLGAGAGSVKNLLISIISLIKSTTTTLSDVPILNLISPFTNPLGSMATTVLGMAGSYFRV